MANMDEVLNEARKEIRQLAAKSLKAYTITAITDGENFIAEIKPDLVRWSTDLQEGHIDRSDFVSLVEGRGAVAQMDGLRQAGVSRSEIDAFTGRLVDVIITAALSGTDSPGPGAR